MRSEREKRRRIAKIQKRKNRIRLIIRYTILFIISIMISYMSYGIYKEESIRTVKSEENIKNNIPRVESDDNKEFEKVKQIMIPVAEEYEGYQVNARLEIPKIKLNTNVLSEYSKEGLAVCASKYYGPSANEVGNYCIAAHNQSKENMFNHLIDLKIGDSIFLTDNTNGMVEYKVYDMYKVKPQNVEPLSQETKGKREITLITCVNYSSNRLIVKAIETDKEA